MSEADKRRRDQLLDIWENSDEDSRKNIESDLYKEFAIKM